MKERPMLFSAPMVRAILDGKKTQTRRIVKPARCPDYGCLMAANEIAGETLPSLIRLSPYGQPGDRLWVRETWQHTNSPHGHYEPGCTCFYRADYLDDPHGMDGEKSPEGKYRTWIPSIHMFRSASRITLEVVSVRVERLNDISESDCWAEGIEEVTGQFNSGDKAEMAYRLNANMNDAKPLYALLWESINGVRSWHRNPWIWVVEFRRVLA